MRTIRRVATLSIIISMLAACGGLGNNTDGDITLQFAMQVNEQDIACGQEYAGLGAAAPA